MRGVSSRVAGRFNQKEKSLNENTLGNCSARWALFFLPRRAGTGAQSSKAALLLLRGIAAQRLVE